MTGTPADVAAATDGLIAVPSWARMTSTLAPCESRFSTLLAWVSADDLASFDTYVPPPASIAAFMAGSSNLAQRGSWKLFQDTPTTQSPPAAPLPAGAAEPAGASDPAGA